MIVSSAFHDYKALFAVTINDTHVRYFRILLMISQLAAFI
jgi:hypothetical protein